MPWLILFTFSVTASAATFTTVFPDYPARLGESCSISKKMAAQFSKVTGYPAEAGPCVDSVEPGARELPVRLEIKIRYRAPRALNELELESLPFETFASEEACNQARHRASSRLYGVSGRTNTLFSYCRRDPTSPHRRWVPFVRVYGAARAQHHLFSFRVEGRLEWRTLLSLLSAVRWNLHNVYPVMAALPHPDERATQIVVSHYSRAGWVDALGTSPLFGTNTREQCQEQIGRAMFMFEWDLRPMFAFCTQSTNQGWHGMGLWRRGAPEIPWSDEASGLQSFAECEKRRAELDLYRGLILQDREPSSLCARVFDPARGNHVYSLLSPPRPRRDLASVLHDLALPPRRWPRF